MTRGSKLIAYYAIINDGDWHKLRDSIMEKKHPSEEEVDSVVSKIKCKYITLLDSEYPEPLKKIYKPPLILFYYGDISLIRDEKKNISIVGSRKPEKSIIEPTKAIIKEISKKLNVVSGLSYGIDAIAHETCLSAGGKTIAVLGNGIEFIYLDENKELYEHIKKDGLIISEYPGYTEPNKDNFPFRNRIIASLSKGMFIPDIKVASGTYSSMSNALVMGKDVFVLPHLPMSQTINNTLIKEGAIIVDTAEDILDEYA